MVDCGIKKAMLIGNVNKSYCCSSYGSMLWKYNCKGFDLKSWHIDIGTSLSLPYNTQTRYLGRFIGQQHIRTQLFLWNAY